MPARVDAVVGAHDDHGGHADHRVAGGRLFERRVRRARVVERRREDHLRQQLVVVHRRGEGPLEEPVGWHRPAARGGTEHELRTQREQRGRQVRGRVRVGDGAAHGAAVADLDIADPGQHVLEHAVVPGRRVHELRVGRQRADREPAVVELPHAAELRDPPDVHQRGRAARAAASSAAAGSCHRRSPSRRHPTRASAAPRRRCPPACSSNAAGIMPGLPSRSRCRTRPPGSRPRPSGPCTACRDAGSRAG